MSSKVKNQAGSCRKGKAGERRACQDIHNNCPELGAERNARNGKACTDILVWELCSVCQGGFDDQLGIPPPCTCEEADQRRFEVKRVEGLDLGTKAMDKIRATAERDGAAGILWRPNNKPWRLDCQWYGQWVTFSGDSVWRMVERLVQDAPASPGRG